ncbi:MAG: DUF3822 family protein [Flavobacteriia bacterium]|nr:DUF3822 family protein [Flavobacteriia bacterium]
MLAERFHPDYNPSKDHAWHLSVWLAPDLCAWCIHERSTGHLMALAAQGGDTLPLPDRMASKPSSVSFTAMPEVSTLVPASALQPGTEMQHLKLVHGKVPSGLLRDEPLATLGAHCLYLHDEQVEQDLLKRYPGARSLPLQGTLVGHALGRSSNGPVVVLHRSSNRLDVVVADHGKLLLSNAFYATMPEDVLYYALFAVDQCHLTPNAVSLYAGGTHLMAREEHLVSGYFERGLLPSTGPGDHVLAKLNVSDAHRWTGLIEQFPCAS